MVLHLSDSRGIANHGWPKSRHTFSFADYYNPERMGFGALRVINDDIIAPGTGFDTHPHREMEIISVPIEGALAHRDSEGNSIVIKKGDIQVMSAGTGIFHSEFNASQTDTAKFLQIWIFPKNHRVKPRYDQKSFDYNEREFTLIASPDGREDSLKINQDAFLTIMNSQSERELIYKKRLDSNGIYIFVIKGVIEVAGTLLNERDGFGIESFDQLKIKSKTTSEILLMEVPMR